jgi:hypothetical protein
MMAQGGLQRLANEAAAASGAGHLVDPCDQLGVDLYVESHVQRIAHNHPEGRGHDCRNVLKELFAAQRTRFDRCVAAVLEVTRVVRGPPRQVVRKSECVVFYPIRKSPRAKEVRVVRLLLRLAFWRDTEWFSAHFGHR